MSFACNSFALDNALLVVDKWICNCFHRGAAEHQLENVYYNNYLLIKHFLMNFHLYFPHLKISALRRKQVMPWRNVHWLAIGSAIGRSVEVIGCARSLGESQSPGDWEFSTQCWCQSLRLTREEAERRSFSFSPDKNERGELVVSASSVGFPAFSGFWNFAIEPWQRRLLSNICVL